jgi:hypothetical protein
MNLTETISTQPLTPTKSARRDEIRAITSAGAGKVIPLAYTALLREDRVSRGRATVTIDVAEMPMTLMNGQMVRVRADLIPFTAFDRFNGVDQFNRSYMGVPETEGGAVVPFFETITYDRNADLFKVMGIHAKDGTALNSAVVEAYNVLVNHRRKARSTKLPLRSKNDTTLAEAFWLNTGFNHIVPDFDQAMLDGEVDLMLESAQLPVKGIPLLSTASSGPYNVTDSDGTAKATVISNTSPRITMVDGLPEVFAEMQSQGLALSLQNIEQAKKTVAFANIRKQYSGLDDDYIIDLLMQAVRVPDAALMQPIPLDSQTTMVGYSKRYASDGANLDKAVTTGLTQVTLNMRTPPINTGGIILISCEIVPEQMFERQKDHFLYTTSVDSLPNYTRDFLDPEKVDIVTCDHVDVEHSTPDATFGYAPLNHVWNRSIPRIGGKFHRQIGDPFDENRQRIWTVETTDPTLTDDFYLAGSIHHNVFADTLSDPYEITTLGVMDIVGNTVFGKRLLEDTGDYDAVSEDVDNTRIDQTA